MTKLIVNIQVCLA